MVHAVADNLDPRESIQFIVEWDCYMRTWEEPLTHVAGMMPIQVMIFWVALWRGWGSWRPTAQCINRVRDTLLGQTTINRRFLDGECQQLLRTSPFATLRETIDLGDLPGTEINRLNTSIHLIVLMIEQRGCSWHGARSQTSLVCRGTHLKVDLQTTNFGWTDWRDLLESGW